jgi:hypothetical protein
VGELSIDPSIEPEHQTRKLLDAGLPTVPLSPSRREAFMATRKRSTRKSTGRRYGKGASKSVESAMRRRKKGTLRRGKSGRGGKVKSREQAIAIGLSEARKKGAKVPPKKSSRGKGSKRKRSR